MICVRGIAGIRRCRWHLLRLTSTSCNYDDAACLQRMMPTDCVYIPEGDCDCDGNQLDVLGVCGGDCVADADADGICDDVDDCVGELDECGICNGPGAIYECGCADIPEGDCDCDGNQLDALASVVVTAQPTKMPMAFVMTSIHCVGELRRVRHLQRSWRHLRMWMC